MRAWLHGHRDALLADADALAPSPTSYSPLGVAGNFPANASVTLVAAVFEDGHSWAALNTLYAREGPDPKERTAERLVRRLMTFSSEPTRLRARRAPYCLRPRTTVPIPSTRSFPRCANDLFACRASRRHRMLIRRWTSE